MKKTKPKKVISVGNIAIRVGDKVLYLTLQEVRALYRSLGGIFQKDDPVQWTLRVGNNEPIKGNSLEFEYK